MTLQFKALGVLGRTEFKMDSWTTHQVIVLIALPFASKEYANLTDPMFLTIHYLGT